MKVLMFLADGFEDSEALVTRDVLIRAGIEVITASSSGDINVRSSFGLNLKADTLSQNITSLDTFACLIFPGGGKGTNNLLNSNEIERIMNLKRNDEFLLAAICAAPSVLNKFQLLKNKKYTCFSGVNKQIDGDFTQSEVEVTENIITARSMGYSIPFALAIINKLLGKDAKLRVEKQISGLYEK